VTLANHLAGSGATLDQIWEASVTFWGPVIAHAGESAKELRVALREGDLQAACELIDVMCPGNSGGADLGKDAITMLAAIALAPTYLTQLVCRCHCFGWVLTYLTQNGN
jgi:hypothetical protein